LRWPEAMSLCLGWPAVDVVIGLSLSSLSPHLGRLLLFLVLFGE
jgi:hypothetical protein